MALTLSSLVTNVKSAFQNHSGSIRNTTVALLVEKIHRRQRCCSQLERYLQLSLLFQFSDAVISVSSALYRVRTSIRSSSQKLLWRSLN